MYLLCLAVSFFLCQNMSVNTAFVTSLLFIMCYFQKFYSFLCTLYFLVYWNPEYKVKGEE